MSRFRSLLLTTLTALTFGLLNSAAGAQVIGGGTQPLVFGGVQISPDGVLSSRSIPAAKPVKHDPKLAYISLPRALDELKTYTTKHTQRPADLVNLGNLTQIHFRTCGNIRTIWSVFN